MAWFSFIFGLLMSNKDKILRYVASASNPSKVFDKLDEVVGIRPQTRSELLLDSLKSLQFDKVQQKVRKGHNHCCSSVALNFINKLRKLFCVLSVNLYIRSKKTEQFTTRLISSVWPDLPQITA